MTIAVVAPTPERLAKGSWLKPEVSQSVNRQYHRGLDLFDRLHNSGHLDQAQHSAAVKLRKHYEGWLGRDVRSDDASADVTDLDGIPARTYHSDKIAEARRRLPDHAWRIMEFVLLGCERLDDLGRVVLHIANEKKARYHARKALQEGLDILAVLWGLSQRHP